MKFYGSTIKNIPPQFLFLATPFSKITQINFKNSISERQFFEELYAKGTITGSGSEVNRKFKEDVDSALEATQNPFSKVDLIHIAGYAGCGKSTFVRHILWEHFGESPLQVSVVDFEGEKGTVAPLIKCISQKIYAGLHRRKSWCSSDIAHFETGCFNDIYIQLFIGLLGEICLKQDELSVDMIEQILAKKKQELNVSEDYIHFLLLTDFLWNISISDVDDKTTPFIIFFDNVDSVKDLEQEHSLVSALKQLIGECNFFFSMNLNNDRVYNGQCIKDIIARTKYICFLTTRIVTFKKLYELEPDLEKIYGWTSLNMPEFYYSHIEILEKRTAYYVREEDGHEGTEYLKTFLKFARIIYKNNIFARMFNGSYRYSVLALCEMIWGNSDIELREDCIRLSESNPLSNEILAGLSGMVIGLLCRYLKRNDIYSEKLHLSECAPDGKVSLSRIILTILNEKGGGCSMLDLLFLLSPFFSSEEICKTTYALNEAKRTVMRRMLTFGLVYPKNEEEFLEQGKRFDEGNFDIELYSEISLCVSGKAYLDYIVPHFEFMLSRHKITNQIANNSNYWPLFCESSEKKLSNNFGGQVYCFERKIDWVFNDVKDCCSNSTLFSEKVISRFFNNSRDVYIKNSYFNYHSTNRDGYPKFRQSYEARLIFSQVGYIERYRRYLLSKNISDELKVDYNQRLVSRIRSYIELYKDSSKCYQTDRQDESAEYMLHEIEVIEKAEYRNFVTKIETPGKL